MWSRTPVPQYRHDCNSSSASPWAGAHPADLLRADQAACLQNLEMLQHGRQRDGERLGKLADRGRPTAQPLDHDPAGRIGKGLEEAVEPSRLVKHILKYSDHAAVVNPCQRTQRRSDPNAMPSAPRLSSVSPAMSVLPSGAPVTARAI